jgi:hypothetical protein
MKIIQRILVSVLIPFNLALAASPQDEAEEEFRGSRDFILIRNDAKLLTEVHRGQYGMDMVCYNKKQTKRFFYEIDEDILRGQFTALVMCNDGEIFFFRGRL